MKIISGSLEDLPSLGSRIVRIFTSSTFTGKGNRTFTNLHEMGRHVCNSRYCIYNCRVLLISKREG